MSEPTEAMPWWERAIRDLETDHGPSGDAWNISMVLDRLRRAAPADAVEAVARAICNADGEDPDLDLAGPNGRSGIPNWHPYRNLALAAMSAQFDKGEG